MKRIALFSIIAGLLVLAGCAPIPATPVGSAPTEPATAVPAATSTAEAGATPAPTLTAAPSATATAEPAATATPEAAPETPAGTPTIPPGFTTHRDPEAGLAIDYPAGWSILVPPAEQRRTAQVYSASIRSFQPGTAGPGGQGLPPGETGIDVTVSRTTATTFEEIVSERRREIANSETAVTIASEEYWTLTGGLRAVRWQLETAMAGTVAEVATLIGGNRVQVDGMGNLEQFDAIARTLRSEETPQAQDGATPAASPEAGGTYSAAELGFTMPLPAAWEMCTQTTWSRVFCRKQAEASGPSFPRFFVTILSAGFTNDDASAYNFIPANDIRAFLGLAPGESHTAYGTPGYSDFTRLPDTTVDGLPGIVIENSKVWEGGPDTRDRRVLVNVASSTYVFGTYYETADELAEFERVLAGVTITAQ